MRRARLRLLCLGLLGPALAIGGCAEAYNRDDFIAELMDDNSMTRDQAVCIADKMEAEIGTDRMGETGDPTDAEEDIAAEAALTCLLDE